VREQVTASCDWPYGPVTDSVFDETYHRAVPSELDARPTVEALEEERRRLKELERNLAAERNRVQEAATKEIARMQAALREAADRAGKRERELERTQRKLERAGRGGRLAAFGLAGRSPDRDQAIAQREARADERERTLAAAAAELEREVARLRELEATLAESRTGVEQAEALAADAAELEVRKADLDRKVEELVEAERRSAELLAARAAELEERSADLRARQEAFEAERSRAVAGVSTESETPKTEGPPNELDDRSTLLASREAEIQESVAALERRERELAELRNELQAEQERLADRAQRLAEAERQAPIRGRAVPSMTFSEGIRALSRRRAG
jgi:chromosome segregation ATPase